MEVRGQPVGLGSFLLLCGAQEWNLGSISRLDSEHLHLLNQHPANGCFLFAFLID